MFVQKHNPLFEALECLLSALGLGCPDFLVGCKTFLVLVRLIAALLHSAPPEAASLRGAPSERLFVAIVRGGTATLKHMDGIYTSVLHFLLDFFAKQERSSFSIFGEGLYNWVQFLQNLAL